MPTTRQDQQFAEEMQGYVDQIIISKSALDAAIDYIGSQLDPSDVFSEKDLIAWAESNGYTKE